MPPGHQEIVGRLSDMNMIKVIICVSLLILAILACNLPSTALPTGVTIEQALTFAVQTIEAQTITAQASISPGAPAEVASATSLADTIPTAQELPLTFTVVFVLTDPPTITFTSPPTVPVVHVSTATHCRTGPGQAYEIVTAADVGIKFEVIGKYTPDNYWIIKLPDGRRCWLWGSYATLEGNISGLPEYIPPPMPLPLVGSIQGVVKGIDIHGKTITFAGTIVKIEPAGLIAYTDKYGNYSVSDVQIGEVTIKFEYPDYAFRTLTNIIVRAGERTQAPMIIGQAVTPGPTPIPPCPVFQFCIPVPTQHTAP